MECLESEQSTRLDKEQISKIEEAIYLKKKFKFKIKNKKSETKINYSRCYSQL
ncbi:MAG: hypothetical protein Ct9H90mP4_09630 [Gammaproteobacteria bacterium]|nr:MAG: hypothetical protein Ct9H90mP4_09630 [Gammaproteobacteria bacterium]